MQAVESENLILYHTTLRGQRPEAAARALAMRLPHCAVAPGEIVFAQGEKPRLAAEPSLAAAAGGTPREVRAMTLAELFAP